jgi:hypothetical protein
MRRGGIVKTACGLVSSLDGRQVFLRGMNVPAKLPPFEYGLKDSDCVLLQASGLTTVRLGVQWEAIEPEEGCYDQRYISYVQSVVQMCGCHGLTVIIDPHQDCWSRWCGGDGAPRWTMERVGLLPECFEETGSVLRADDKAGRNPMLWATNYELFACATMFSLFFGGNRYAPGVCVDGIPVQRWLQTKFINAVATVARALRLEENVLGFGTMNEPSLGWIGVEDLRSIPVPWRFGYNLSPWQSMQLAAGTEMRWVVLFGTPLVPSGFRTLNSKQQRACRKDPWEAVGVWEDRTIHRPQHFQFFGDPIQAFLRPFWDAFSRRIREECDFLIFTEAPPLRAFKPRFDFTARSFEIPSPHFYDTVAVALQRYVSWLALDFAYEGWMGPLCVGRASAKQARHNSVELLMKKRGGIMLGEVGAPWAARDAFEATFRAVESNLVQVALIWCYCPNGDRWNGEDFSIVTADVIRLSDAVRPYACRVAGRVTKMEWENGVFLLEFLDVAECNSIDTEVFLPELQFPCGAIKVEVSDGEWSFERSMLTFRHTPGGAVHRLAVKRAVL